VRRHQPELAARASFEFVGVPDDDDAGFERAVQRLVQTRPAVIVAPNGKAALYASRWGGPVPVVFSSYVDPVRYRIVDALLRREAPITGIWIADYLDSKRLETLRDAYPWVRTVAVLADPTWNESVRAEQTLPAAAARLGLSVSLLYAADATELKALLDRPESTRHDAWCVPRSYLAVLASAQIRERLRAWGKPSIFATTADVVQGSPMAYALDLSFVWPALADLVARVAGGEPAGSIPVQRPQRYVLSVRTGEDTGVPLPAIGVLRRADTVVR